MPQHSRGSGRRPEEVGEYLERSLHIAGAFDAAGSLCERTSSEPTLLLLAAKGDLKIAVAEPAMPERCLLQADASTDASIAHPAEAPLGPDEIKE